MSERIENKLNSSEINRLLGGAYKSVIMEKERVKYI